ncbi:hypothetical protein JCGZ_25473 [Jatropha curcas]|uniref:Uncharacterized protein n=1 Tax=Jatropha curcas TaxID=180498 RepID=A0A067L804_JATCU|nr:hypothetical protein JCGZ_25473 [Jatropha curcas]
MFLAARDVLEQRRSCGATDRGDGVIWWWSRWVAMQSSLSYCLRLVRTERGPEWQALATSSYSEERQWRTMAWVARLCCNSASRQEMQTRMKKERKKERKKKKKGGGSGGGSVLVVSPVIGGRRNGEGESEACAGYRGERLLEVVRVD